MLGNPGREQRDGLAYLVAAWEPPSTQHPVARIPHNGVRDIHRAAEECLWLVGTFVTR